MLMHSKFTDAILHKLGLALLYVRGWSFAPGGFRSFELLNLSRLSAPIEFSKIGKGQHGRSLSNRHPNSRKAHSNVNMIYCSR